ncbi:ferritin-like domain-containing protein [Lederbergia citrea]|uniref:Ferritin-like domain-containing protein n=1 Tax=Lederbergia citrea TaxID=2833581 RepID=A0A942Z550_9BACI|nr:ferritin-like domain-containing protein [Lederbergia citrea]MBS4178632.1 ferritin-like domain-containing protein [Lederbergia citrea]MBS4205319.1 ferritin-like domain-containing protein [Lederbergia citrea]MBS4224369.1 ferritin-like domain-containing protein [Lederbergia citrea]
MVILNNFHQDKALVNKIAKAINGEYSAINCYGKLITMSSTETEKDRINEIRNDEIRHFNEFCAIYTLITNQQPHPQISEQCPDQYKAGLEFAFEDEQHTVDFYHEIADQAIHPYIRRRFNRAAADEQNHAVWFLSMLHK